MEPTKSTVLQDISKVVQYKPSPRPYRDKLDRIDGQRIVKHQNYMRFVPKQQILHLGPNQPNVVHLDIEIVPEQSGAPLIARYHNQL